VLPIEPLMEPARDQFPWRPLGTLLVDEGLLTSTQLELALDEQRRSGRLLGQILVNRGYVTGLALARVLSEQHGVEVRPSAAPAEPPAEPQPEPARTAAPDARGEESWLPLGKLLVERRFLTEPELEAALDEQGRHGGRLGEILVARGYLSGPTLVRALAEQHGVDVSIETVPDRDLETVVKTSAPGEPLYEVCDVGFEPGFQSRSVVYRNANFLEAADFAFEYVQEHNPDALEIQLTDGTKVETVWTYSESRAAAAAASRKDLVETFGFDPTTWEPGRFNPAPGS
jgi:hypothetical protein